MTETDCEAKKQICTLESALLVLRDPQQWSTLETGVALDAALFVGRAIATSLSGGLHVVWDDGRLRRYQDLDWSPQRIPLVEEGVTDDGNRKTSG